MAILVRLSLKKNIGDYLSPDCATVAEFILDNLGLFADEYNKTLGEEDEKFVATSCEFSAPVYIESFDQEGLYLDFNDSNGYMIVVDEYSVVAFDVKGDLDYLRGQDYLYYSVYDGFLYQDGTGNYIPYYFQQMTEEDWDSYAEIALGKSNGQLSGTDGEIVDPDAYVKDKYGKGYTVYQQKTLENYQYVDQSDLSIYYEIEENLTYSEGNCSLASIYSLMNYLKTSGKYKNLPSSTDTTTYNAEDDHFYAKYKKKSNYKIQTQKELPDLYLAVREYAIDKLGYQVSGTNPFNIEKMIEKVGEQYNCKINATHILIWSYSKQVVNEINAGYPVIWNMANSSTYGSHTTVVTGYRTYRKIKSFLGIKFHSYVKLALLNDNWDPYGKYFDFTNYMAFGSFVKVR